jgi:hypothetical protein
MYITASALLIMGFRFIFPGEDSPLPVFSRNWRIIRGALDLLTLFPALAMSALVVPFGLTAYEDYHTSFSPRFFQRLTPPVITAICAAVAYSVVFFLALPLARDAETDMRYRGELYRLAKERARIHGRAGEWLEASQFIRVCDRIWPDSPELASLRTEADIRINENEIREEDRREEARVRLAGERRSADLSSLPGQRQPLDVTEALAQGEAAFNERRYYDAHWLATLGERLARTGSPEAVTAARLAAQAWNQIEAQRPNSREEQHYALYRLKRSGYEAMVAGEWIRAYYIFLELSGLTPDDPDAHNYLEACERGTRETAFFIDEMEVSLGEILTGALLSIPAADRGRVVMRISSLSASPDIAYGIGFEYMSFDAQSRPLAQARASYVKITPFTLDGRHKVLVLLRALNRQDEKIRWEPEWSFGAGTGPRPDNIQITLDVSYEELLLLLRIRQGFSDMQLPELFSTAKIIGADGYAPEVFEAEILNRLGTALFFLPLTIAIITIGWRFRAKSRARYLFILLLPVLPVVFHGLSRMARSVLNTAGIWLLLAMGFSNALAVYIAVLVVSFIVSLIVLAAQHG